MSFFLCYAESGMGDLNTCDLALVCGDFRFAQKV